MADKVKPSPNLILFVSVAVVSAIAGAASALLSGWIGGAVAAVAAGITSWFLFSSRLSVPAAPPQVIPAAPPAETAAATVKEPEAVVISADRTDPLTGLANGNGLAAWFAEKGARLAADGKSIIVLVAGLDDFDQFTARRGQAVANDVLKEIAARVAVVAGSDGIAARTDGEEFASVVAVVPGRAEALASERSGHLIELIGRPVEHPSGSIWLGGSVGAAYGSPLSGPAVLARARTALTQATRLGRGQCVVAKPE